MTSDSIEVIFDKNGAIQFIPLLLFCELERSGGEESYGVPGYVDLVNKHPKGY